jgi:glutamate racemase
MKLAHGSQLFVEKNITQLLSSDPEIDTIILGCTHYPLLSETIRKYLPDGSRL